MLADRIVAPDGFVSYKWTRSSNANWVVYTRQVNVQYPIDGEIITCTLRSQLGCESEVKIVFRVTSVDVDFMFGVKDTNAHVDFAAHANQNWYDTCSRTATFVDFSQVINSKKQSIMWEIIGLKVNSSDSMFTYTFPTPDTPTTYQVRLIVYAGNGCAGAFSQSITIYPSFSKDYDSIYVHFSTPQKTYCNKTNIIFTNQSEATRLYFFPDLDCSSQINVTCMWNFGDGYPVQYQKIICGDPIPNISHQYNFPDTSTKVVVSLRAWLDDNPACEAVFTDTLTIIRPIAGFTSGERRFLCPTANGITVNFADSSTPTSNITYYTWNFGDLSSGTDNIAHGTNMTTASHLYKNAGLYDVTLIVMDNYGCTDTMFKPQHVFIDGPAGDFTYSPLSGCLEMTTVRFTPEIYKDNFDKFTADSVLWYPDGITLRSTSIGEGVGIPYRHLFREAGAYIPIMQMTKWVDNNGTKERCLVTKIGQDTIWMIGLTPDFTTEDAYAVDSLVEFINTTQVQPIALQADSIYWDYGNGDFLWIYNPATELHNGRTTYSNEGTYRVTLTEYYKACSQSQSYDILVVEDLGISQLTINNGQLTIFPNPTSGQLKITNYELKENTVIEIYNIVGQVVLSTEALRSLMTLKSPETNETTIDVSGLTNGMYFLKIDNKIVKFIKE